MKQVVAALIVRGDRLLVCQRTEAQTMPLKWEFPGGKVETGEQPREALRRELEEELGIDALIEGEVACVEHRYADGTEIELHFFLVRQFAGDIQNRIFRDVRWPRRSDLLAYDFLEADLKLLKDLAEGKLV
jgi:8-oxo-dGTP diphosphatase